MLSIHGEAIQGARDYQEDFFEICSEAVDNPDGCLVVLCDGMGGHSGGALASKIAANAFINEFLACDVQSLKEAFELSLSAAHAAIKHEVAENAAPADMGTTLLAVYVSNCDVHWLSVGDSHLFLFSKGNLKKLNQDHSMATVLDELVEIGRISEDEAKSDPQRSSLRSCLSVDEITLIDIQSMPRLLKTDAKLILATDGIDTLDKADLTKNLVKSKKNTPDIVVSKLLKAVESEKRANQDNTTIIVISSKHQSRLSKWFGFAK